jgi:integrase
MTRSKNSKRSKRTRSYLAGEKGNNRVRLYPHPRDGTLMLEYRDKNGRRRNRSLQHDDLARGKIAADELAAALRKQEAPHSDELTLSELFDNYVREVTPRKSAAKQRHDATARSLFERCWGAGTRVSDLDSRHWERFIEQRRSGILRPAGSKTTGGVRNRIIGYDLKFLMAVCNWAETVRVGRHWLLDRNPFRNFEIPREKNPRQPSITEAEYEALTTAAREIGRPEIELFLFLTHESGHRGASVRELRWSDIDLINRRIFWAKDKEGRQHTTPLLPEQVEVIKRWRRENPGIGDGWVFPAPRDPDSPIPRRQVSRWWQILEKRAQLPRVKGRGWHSLRRKFADESDELPAAQLMALGGWKSYKTIVEIYQKPREEKLRAALALRADVRRRAKLEAMTTANDNQGVAAGINGVQEVVAFG